MRAHLIGGGIASLAAAAYLIRDGGLAGEAIRVYEATERIGGALDASGSPESGYFMRGGRMFERNYRCTYDLLSFIPSISDPTKSVKEEIFDFSKAHSWDDKARLVGSGGRILDAHSYGLSRRDQWDMIKLALTPERALENKRTAAFFSPSFFETNFWSMWASIFAFAPWYSAIDMHRYIWRFLHLFPTMATMSSVYRTRYNQFEAIVTPLMKWLKGRGVNFITGAHVTDVDFLASTTEITATGIKVSKDDKSEKVDVAPTDLVFVNAGSMVADSARGSMTAAPEFIRSKRDDSWKLWATLARGKSIFGNPSVFSDHVDESAWVSFTVTSPDSTFVELMEKFSRNKAGRGGLVTFKDSNWLLTIVLLQHPYFVAQPRQTFVWWGYGLYPDRLGNYVNKKMTDCTGAEILSEILGHLKFDTEAQKILASSNCIPCLLPYIGSVFMVRQRTDRPEVVPRGSTNFAFLGQFTEIPADVPFTVEYSVRSALTAVTKLLGLKRRAPPVYQGQLDLKALYGAFKALCS